jgi:DNA-binding NarL/FixJ family response regulator
MCGEQEQARLEDPEFDPGTITTIVVDDSSFMQEGIGRLLRRIEGVEVKGTASDGIEGVNLAVAMCPDLVLMDFQMPHMDGLTAARLIREAHPEVKIVLITAHDIDAVRRHAFVSHVDDVLCKQELPSRLANTIRELFADR